MRLPITLIRRDGGTQARVSLSDEVIEEYATAMRQGHSFPAVVVFYDGSDYWLADGFHRVNASIKAGFQEIEVELRMGKLREAILYAVGANASHGLRRTPVDKRYAVSIMLKDPEWSQWSDRSIAKATQTSHPFVAKLRASLTGNISSERVYTTKHGTQTKMNVSQIGKSHPNSARVQRWLGLDPGLAVVRWAVLEDRDGVPILLDYGEIETQRKCPTSERLWELEQDLVALLREFQPTVIGIEKPVINRQFNHLTGVLEAMGVIHLVCYREMGLVPVHLSPKMWKHNLADGAGIEEITEIIASLFELSPSSRKRLDAIGIAYGAFCGVAME